MDKSFIINMAILHENSQNDFNAHIREKKKQKTISRKTASE